MYFPLGVPPLIELFFLPFFHFKDKLTSVFGKKKKINHRQDPLPSHWKLP